MEKRTANIELLRIVSLIMTLVLHYLLQGKVLEALQWGSADYVLFWTLEAMALVSVNCYIMISGYCLAGKSFKLRRLVSFYAEVFFYSVAVYLCCVLTGLYDFSLKGIVYALLPITSRRSWFLTVYFAMYLLMPLLNRIVDHCSKRFLGNAIVVMVLLFSVLSTIGFYADPFNVASGYSLSWFVAMFFVGAYIKKYQEDITGRVTKGKACVCYILTILLLPLSRIVIEFVTLRLLGQTYKADLLYTYNSIACCVASIGLFLFFVQVEIRNVRLAGCIRKIASTALGVICIHSHFALRDQLWLKLGSDQQNGILGQLLNLVFAITVVFLFCAVIDLARQTVHKKLIDTPGMREKLDAIDRKIGWENECEK